MRVGLLLPFLIVWLVLCGCDRNMEPYVPGEQPRPPDLAKIFPAGAERPAAAAPQAAATSDGGRGAAPASSAGAGIEGTVELAEGVAGRIPPGAVLFVIARTSAAGPPLAVKRVAAPSFPFAFHIGPEDRMIQAMPFVGPIQISARIDRDGNPMTRDADDLEGQSEGGVEPGATGVVIRIEASS